MGDYCVLKGTMRVLNRSQLRSAAHRGTSWHPNFCSALATAAGPGVLYAGATVHGLSLDAEFNPFPGGYGRDLTPAPSFSWPTRADLPASLLDTSLSA